MAMNRQRFIKQPFDLIFSSHYFITFCMHKLIEERKRRKWSDYLLLVNLYKMHNTVIIQKSFQIGKAIVELCPFLKSENFTLSRLSY
jgi:hypothetical protein